MSALAIERLSYSYPERTGPALKEISLKVAPGEFIVLAGSSGSGKSTILKAAAGLVPHFHGGEFSGNVQIGELNTRESGPSEIAAVAGYLAQEPETQVVLATVRAELTFPLENRGMAAHAVARAVEETALALGISHLLDRSTHDLSGGELQRVALAATLAGRPQILLLDEPTSQLDPVAGDELLGFLRRINQDWGTAVLLAEHRLERCLSSADRVVAVEEGRLVADCPPREFLQWAAGRECDLQTPAARLFTAAEISPLPLDVKEARALLGARSMRRLSPSLHTSDPPKDDTASPEGAVLSLKNIWSEIKNGPTILRAINFTLSPGEAVALMGQNGAGKSTLLRIAAGVQKYTRGKREVHGCIRLLLQNPGDFFIRGEVEEEATAPALKQLDLLDLRHRNPRDLSGGEQQRLAIASVLESEDGQRTLLLDEPTRGMDRSTKRSLATLIRQLTKEGVGVVVATHDPEFAAAFATRAVLMGKGQIVSDGPAREFLSGGLYFATQTARILGEESKVLLPEEGARLLATT